MSVLFFAGYMHEMFLMPLNTSRIRRIFSCLLDVFFVSDALFDLSAHFLQLLLVFFLDFPPSSSEYGIFGW